MIPPVVAAEVRTAGSRILVVLTFDPTPEPDLEALAERIEAGLADRGYAFEAALPRGENVIEIDAPLLWEPLLAVALFVDNLRQVLAGKPARVTLADPAGLPR